MSEFFHNLSMQALNWSDDRIEIKLNAVNRLNKNINNLLITEANRFRNKFKEQNLSENFVEHKTENQKFEDDIVRNILNDIKIEHPQETDHLTFLNTAEEIKRQVAEELEQKIKLDLARNERDWEIMEVIALDAKKDLIKALAGLDVKVSSEVSNLTGLATSKKETSNQNLKDHFEQTSTKMIQENNIDIVSKMLVDDVITEYFDEVIEENEKTLPTIAEIIENDSFTETPVRELRRSKRITEKNKKSYDKK